MNIAVYDALTVVLIILSSTSYIPQLIRIIKTKNTKSLSLVPWLLYDLYFVLYMTLLITDNASIMVIILGTVNYMICVIITLSILRYRQLECVLH